MEYIDAEYMGDIADEIFTEACRQQPGSIDYVDTAIEVEIIRVQITEKINIYRNTTAALMDRGWMISGVIDEDDEPGVSIYLRPATSY